MWILFLLWPKSKNKILIVRKNKYKLYSTLLMNINILHLGLVSSLFNLTSKPLKYQPRLQYNSTCMQVKRHEEKFLMPLHTFTSTIRLLRSRNKGVEICGKIEIPGFIRISSRLLEDAYRKLIKVIHNTSEGNDFAQSWRDLVLGQGHTVVWDFSYFSTFKMCKLEYLSTDSLFQIECQMHMKFHKHWISNWDEIMKVLFKNGQLINNC